MGSKEICTKHRARVALWGLAFPVGVAGIATGSLAFFSEPAAEERVKETIAQDGVATIDGARVQVANVNVGAAETLISIEVNGREEMGPDATIDGFASIVDSDGVFHRETGGQVDGRILTVRFSSADLGPGPWLIRLGGLGVGNSGHTALKLGEVRLPVEVVGAGITTVSLDAEGEAAGLVVSVESIAASDGQALVSGRILRLPAGIKESDFRFLGSELVTATGDRLPITEARFGFANDAARFELVARGNLDMNQLSALTLNVPVRGPASAENQLGAVIAVLAIAFKGQ